MSKLQWWALGQFLSEIPENVTYEEALQMVSDEHEDVTHWEPFEHHPGEQVAEFINAMYVSLVDLLQEGV